MSRPTPSSRRSQPYEIQEAYRALKRAAHARRDLRHDGSAARAQSLHGDRAELHARCLQTMASTCTPSFSSPAGPSRFHYERGPTIRASTHELTLETDHTATSRAAFRSAIPRRTGYSRPSRPLRRPCKRCSAYDQTRLHVAANRAPIHQRHRRSSTWPDSYRLPLSGGHNVAEITGVAPSVKGNGITNLFSFDELDGQRQQCRHLAQGLVWAGHTTSATRQIPSCRR